VSKNELNPAFKYSIFSIPATVLFIAPGYTDPINLPKVLALLPFTISAVVLFFALKNYRRSKVNSKSDKFLLAIYSLLALAMLASGFLGSQNYIRVLFGTTGRNNGLIYYLAAISLAVVLVRLVIQELEVSYLNRVLIWSSLAFAFYCAMQFFDLDPVAWNNPYSRVIGTLGNPNFAASALASFAVFWLYLFFRADGQKLNVRSLFLLPALTMIFLSWSTESLQGLIVFALGASLIIYMAIREKYSSSLIPYLFFVGGGLALAIVFTSFLGIGPLGGTLEQYTLKLRGWYASFGIMAMLDSPLTGVGVDNYVSAFMTFKSEEFVLQYGSGLTTNNAHSTPAQIGATFGLAVFLLYCLLHLWILLRALKVISSRATSQFYLKGVALMWILIFSQSLLSIEIIGLGVMNWVLGAIILSATSIRANPNNLEEIRTGKKQRTQSLPAWTGSLTIASLLTGSILVIPVSREDKAFQNLAFIQVADEQSKSIVRQEYEKLSNLTLLYPNKIDAIAANIFKADMSSELGKVAENLYRVDKNDAYAASVLATFYQNTGQVTKELEVRERIRALDPWNSNLELSLARAYAASGQAIKLQESVDRLKSIAPSSEDYQQARSLLKER
jgi:hypothetical protein